MTVGILSFGGQEVVLVHWACTKIIASTDVPDAILLEVLLEKVYISPIIYLNSLNTP